MDKTIEVNEYNNFVIIYTDNGDIEVANEHIGELIEKLNEISKSKNKRIKQEQRIDKLIEELDIDIEKFTYFGKKIKDFDKEYLIKICAIMIEQLNK